MKILAFLAMVTANVLGGVSFLWIRYALEGLPDSELTINAGRTLVAIVCAVPFMLWTSRRQSTSAPFTGVDRLRLAVLGIFCYAAPVWLGTVGVDRSTIGNASILMLVEPAALLVFSWVLLRDRLRRREVAGVVIAFAGASWLITAEALAEESGGLLMGDATGSAILALHAVLWGLYTPVMKPLSERHNAGRLVFNVMLMALIVLVPAALTERANWATAPDPVGACLWIALLGAVISFGTTLCWNFALRHIHASAVAPFIFLQPLAGTLVGVLYGEPLSAGAIEGGLLIAAGLTIVMIAGWRDAAAAQQARRAAAAADREANAVEHTAHDSVPR